MARASAKQKNLFKQTLVFWIPKGSPSERNSYWLGSPNQPFLQDFVWSQMTHVLKDSTGNLYDMGTTKIYAASPPKLAIQSKSRISCWRPSSITTSWSWGVSPSSALWRLRFFSASAGLLTGAGDTWNTRKSIPNTCQCKPKTIGTKLKYDQLLLESIARNIWV